MSKQKSFTKECQQTSASCFLSHPWCDCLLPSTKNYENSWKFQERHWKTYLESRECILKSAFFGRPFTWLFCLSGVATAIYSHPLFVSDSFHTHPPRKTLYCHAWSAEIPLSNVTYHGKHFLLFIPFPRADLAASSPVEKVSGCFNWGFGRMVWVSETTKNLKLMISDSWLLIIWPNGIIFHQPRFPWNKGISLPTSYLLRWGRVRSPWFDQNHERSSLWNCVQSLHSPKSMPSCLFP